MDSLPQKNQNQNDDASSKYETLFENFSELDENNIIMRSNCKFCNHPLRAEAEEKFEVTQSFAPVERLFREYEKSHPKCSAPRYPAIRNHLHCHYLKQEKQLYLKEYAKRHLSWMNNKIEQDKKFESLQAQMEMKLLEIASDPTLDPFKQVDSMTKLGKMILEIVGIQSKLRGELQPISLLSEKFMTVWSKVISQQNDPQTRQILFDALDAFREHMGGVEVEINKEDSDSGDT